LPKFAVFFWSGLFLALIGGGGLAALVIYTLPYLGPRWLFFFLLMLVLCGIALPIVAFLHRRFPTDPPADPNTILRQAMWVGIYGDLLIWLQLGRVLSFNLATYILFGFIIIEFLLRLRESSRWRPKGPGHE
jgi:hypothetical protein